MGASRQTIRIAAGLVGKVSQTSDGTFGKEFAVVEVGPRSPIGHFLKGNGGLAKTE